MEWLKKQGHTVIVSEHRLFYLKNLVDKCLIMKDGKLTDRAGDASIFLK